MIIIESLPCRFCGGYYAVSDYDTKPEHDGKWAQPNYCPACGEGGMYWESDITFQFRVEQYA